MAKYSCSTPALRVLLSAVCVCVSKTGSNKLDEILIVLYKN